MNYKTYAEAKIANPDCEIVTTGKDWEFDKSLKGVFQTLVGGDGVRHSIGDSAWVICNPADYCSTLKEFLEAGFKLVGGDKFIEVAGYVYNVDSDNLNLVNERDSGDCDRYILSAAALNGGCNIPKTEAWTIYNNALPLSELSDEQASQLFNAWRAGGNVECDSFCDKWLCADDCLWISDRVYRIKPKSERKLFIEKSMQLMTSETERTMEQMFGAQFDAGARYTDLTQYFGENI